LRSVRVSAGAGASDGGRERAVSGGDQRKPTICLPSSRSLHGLMIYGTTSIPMGRAYGRLASFVKVLFSMYILHTCEVCVVCILCFLTKCVSFVKVRFFGTEML
jgi:hypothetical protein